MKYLRPKIEAVHYSAFLFLERERKGSHHSYEVNHIKAMRISMRVARFGPLLQ